MDAMQFPLDCRLAEVQKMLRMRTGLHLLNKKPPQQQQEEEELDPNQALQEQLRQVNSTQQARAFGRAILQLGTQHASSLKMPALDKLVVDGRTSATSSEVVNLDAALLPADYQSQLEFHSSVSQGMACALNNPHIDAEWLLQMFHQQSQPAGFVLAMGLSGKLKNVHKYQVFDLLNVRNDQATMSVMLALGASNTHLRQEVAKIIAVHMPGHVNGSDGASVNLSSHVAGAVLVAAGLLYAGTGDQSMTMNALAQIDLESYQFTDMNTASREAYAFQAAVSLGLTCFGLGRDRRVGVELLNNLRVYIKGGSSTKRQHADGVSERYYDAGELMNTAVTGPAAIMALGMCHFNTNCDEALKLIDVPSSQQAQTDIEYLLQSMIARHMIQWSLIEPTADWIQSQSSDQTQDAHQLVLLSASMYSLGLKYAGTLDMALRDVLLKHLKVLMKLTGNHMVDFYRRVYKSWAKRSINICAMSLGMVMAGSCDLAVLKVLRQLFGRTTDSYGDHTMVSMALGMLCMGNGQFSLDVSTPDKVAALHCACYPIMARTVCDNSRYPQYMRHFWLMAAQPRILSLSTGHSIISAQATLTLADGTQSTVQTPCLLPPLHTIIDITVKDARLGTVTVDLVVLQLCVLQRKPFVLSARERADDASKLFLFNDFAQHEYDREMLQLTRQCRNCTLAYEQFSMAQKFRLFKHVQHMEQDAMFQLALQAYRANGVLPQDARSQWNLRMYELLNI